MSWRKALLLAVGAFAAASAALGQQTEPVKRAVGPGQQWKMGRHEYLPTDSYLVSRNGAFHAFQHRDGRFCVYRGSGPRDSAGALWCNNAATKHSFSSPFTTLALSAFCTAVGQPELWAYPPLWCAPLKGWQITESVGLGNDGNVCIYQVHWAEGQTTWCTDAVDPAWVARLEREKAAAGDPNAVRPGAGNSMRAYQFLLVGSYLVSDNKRFFAIQQRDGNLCVYRGSGPDDNQGALWCHSGSRVPTPESYFTVMRGDGNLCTYRGISPGSDVPYDARPLWCALPGERQNVNAGSVVVAYDGNLCVYPTNNPAGQATWCSNAVVR